jgi:hydrogenase maturation protease
MTAFGRTLVLGYGNPGRLDDGLGPAFCRTLEERLHDPWRPGRAPAPTALVIRDAFQLNVEDAAEIAGYDTVLFVDATLPGPGPFRFEPVSPSLRHAEFTTHSASPAGILGLARQIFGAGTRGFTLGIRGVEFRGFGEELSPAAQANLAMALEVRRGAQPRGPGESFHGPGLLLESLGGRGGSPPHRRRSRS